MHATRILETALYVNDLAAAEEFYRRVLGLEFYSKMEGRHVFFRCGPAMFLLFNPDATEKINSALSVGAHGARGAGHAAFASTLADLPQWRAHLQAHGVVIENEIDWPGGGHSIYFRDPAGNSLEIATPQLWKLSDE
jgi:catechol 2,3-dioxygenase-like lactoylglutathione lyase family enzyme